MKYILLFLIAFLNALKPKDFDQKLWCNSCEAISRELSILLKNHKEESYIDEAMSNICKPDRFKVYEFPPPRMFEGCQAFIMEHSDDVFEAFHTRENNQQVESDLCYQRTKACLDEEL